MGLLSHLLHRFVRNGHLLVTDYAGRTYSFGIAGSAPRVAIHLTDKAVEREIFLNPELKTAEAYMDKRLVMKDNTRVFDLLYLFSINRIWTRRPPRPAGPATAVACHAPRSATQSIGDCSTEHSASLRYPGGLFSPLA